LGRSNLTATQMKSTGPVWHFKTRRTVGRGDKIQLVVARGLNGRREVSVVMLKTDCADS